jgi:predicted dehydrogenase
MKVAFAGAGYIVNIHARAAQAQKGVELAAVVEKYSDRAAALAKKFNIKDQYETVEQLLKAGNVDALVIGTPNFLHAPQAITALKAGVHVLVEKPMALNARRAEKMIEASAQSGATLMVAHCWRFDKDVLWLKKQTKKLGKIIRTKGYGVHSNWGPAGWFTQRELAGGGALADMGIHALDTARFLLGDPKPVSVYAKLGTHYKPFDVDDTGTIIVEWRMAPRPISSRVGGSRTWMGPKPLRTCTARGALANCSQPGLKFPMSKRDEWIWSSQASNSRGWNIARKACMTHRWHISFSASARRKHPCLAQRKA